MLNSPVNAHEPEELRAVNALCEYVERAEAALSAIPRAASPSRFEMLPLPGLEALLEPLGKRRGPRSRRR